MSRKSSTTPSSPTSQPEQPLFASTKPTKQSPRRASSLRLRNAKALDVPIPPSLLQSPHLSSPMSPFQRLASVPCTPSLEDEQWLRDTVPLSTRSAPLTRSASSKENTRRTSRSDKHRDDATEGGTTSYCSRKLGLCSPPLVRLGGRQPSQEKVQTPSMHLQVRAEGQEYFLVPNVEK